MKFKIKYADQIVGLFSILAIASVLLLLVFIAIHKNLFTKKNHYFTYFDTVNGISVGMELKYKGFPIGKVTKVKLDKPFAEKEFGKTVSDDLKQKNFVRVDFYVVQDYLEYMREYSLVQLDVSPIGLGSSFTLLPGKGDKIIPDGRIVFRSDPLWTQKLIDDGKVEPPDGGDSISALMGKVSKVLDDVHGVLDNINKALEGKGETPVTKIVKDISDLTGMLSDIENGAVPNLLGEEITKKLAATIGSINGMINDSQGAVPRLLGKDMTAEINAILSNLAPIVANTDALVGNTAPELNEMFAQLNTLLLQMQDLVTGLNNNPLLRGGIPDRSNEKSATVNVRSSDF